MDDEVADAVLVVDGGREVLTCSQLLALASPVLRQALKCTVASRKRGRDAVEHEGASDSGQHVQLPRLQVGGSWEGWQALLQLLHHPFVSGDPLELSPASAFHILPIAHQYNMQGALQRCIAAVKHQASLPLGSLGPDQPPASSSSSSSLDPTLFEWLELADSKQCTPLVHAVLAHLSKAADQEGAYASTSLPVVKSALANPSTRQRLEGFCSGTAMELLNVTAGLPVGFKGVRLPDLNAPPAFKMQMAETGVGGYDARVSFLAGPSQSLLLVPRQNDIEVFNLQDKTSYLLQGHAHPVTDVFGSETLAVSTSGHEGALRVWDLESRQCRQTIQADKEPMAVCLWEGSVACGRGRRDVELQVWDISTGLKVGSGMKGHTAMVSELRLVPSAGGVLVSASCDTTLKVWDVRVGQCVRTLEGHTSWVCSTSVCSQGRTVVSGSVDETVRVWDMGSGRCVHTLRNEEPEDVWQVWLDEAGTTAVSTQDSSLSVWDVSQGRLSSEHSWSDTDVEGLCCNRDLSSVTAVVSQKDVVPWHIWSWGRA